MAGGRVFRTVAAASRIALGYLAKVGVAGFEPRRPLHEQLVGAMSAEVWDG
jgi:hypothetical protein